MWICYFLCVGVGYFLNGDWGVVFFWLGFLMFQRCDNTMIDGIPGLELGDVRSRPFGSGQEYVYLDTDGGCVEGIYRPTGGSKAVIWLGGARGGVDGPAFGVYGALSYRFASLGVGSLRLHYRFPGDFRECVGDVLLGVDFLAGRGVDGVALVGHSFGGAVAIMAGVYCDGVRAVVGLSSQTYGAQNVGDLSPRPLLLVHGERDRNLPASCSHDIYRAAGEPKLLVTFEGCGHFLRECSEEVHDLLLSWLGENFVDK